MAGTESWAPAGRFDIAPSVSTALRPTLTAVPRVHIAPAAARAGARKTRKRFYGSDQEAGQARLANQVVQASTGPLLDEQAGYSAIRMVIGFLDVVPG